VSLRRRGRDCGFDCGFQGKKIAWKQSMWIISYRQGKGGKVHTGKGREEMVGCEIAAPLVWSGGEVCAAVGHATGKSLSPCVAGCPGRKRCQTGACFDRCNALASKGGEERVGCETAAPLRLACRGKRRTAPRARPGTLPIGQVRRFNTARGNRSKKRAPGLD
jgi:hypothetical protein